MDLIFMLLPDKYEPAILAVALVGFFGSEALSMMPWFKSNGWCQAVGNIFRAIVKKFRPELVKEPVTVAQEAQNDVRRTTGETEQRIITPELTEEQRTALNNP